MKQNKIPRNEYIIQPKGKTNPYKHDVIYSDLGQWKYPGQVTRIPSNQITMQGVNYPVQGVDDTGYSQMMYPGMDYQFPGNYVTEYPMARYGGDPSLTNIEGHYPFGGQNTKTHTHMAQGGWLDTMQVGGSRTDVYTDKALYDKAHKAEMDSIMAQGYKDIYKQTWRNLLNAKNESDAIKAADNFKNNYFQKADASPETKALLNQQQRYPVDPEFMEGLIWKTTKEIPWDNVGVSTEDPPRLSPNLYPRVHNIYVPPKPNTQPGPATLKSKPKPRPIEKKKPEVITPEHLPMIEANMPEMRSQEPNITPKFIFPKQSNIYNRISWRMDPETRKMVPVYLEDRKQKVKKGKRLYNEYIPTSTMAIPEDFKPQFNRPEIVEKTDPYWRREYVQPKKVATKKMGGWLDEYQTKGEVKPKIDFEGSRRTSSNSFPTSNIEAEEMLAEQRKPGYKKEDNLEYYREKAYRNKEEETVNTHVPQSTSSKAIEILSNPGLALKNYRGGRLPDYFSSNDEVLMGDPLNVMNMGYQFLTPVGRAAYLAESADNIDRDLENEDYVSAGIDAAFALPGLGSFKKGTKNLSKKGAKTLIDKVSRKILGNQQTDQLKYNINTMIKGYKNEKNFIKENKNELKKLPSLYKQNIKEMTSPEGLARLKKLGVDDPSDFIKFANNVKKTGTSGPSQYLPINQGAVNINPKQLNKYKKTLIPLSTTQNAIDHEYGHLIQHYLENKGKTFRGLTDLDIDAVDELLPHINKKTSDYFKTINGIDPKLVKETAKLNNTEIPLYFFKGSNGAEPIAHLRETKRAMKESGIINNIHENITPQHIEDFIKKTENKDRITSFLQQTPEARKTLSNLLNRTPAIIPTVGAAGVLGASALQEEEDGGFLEDEYKRGGQKKKRYTSKNIQSSVNDLFRRNETLFGPAGKKRYKPGLKYKSGGGWLDNFLD